MLSVDKIERKIHFIDCGANIGQTTAWALKTYGDKLQQIDAFEPQIENFIELERMFATEDRVNLHKCAIWIANEHRMFYPQLTGARTGSSLIRGKSSTSSDVFVRIQCIDILAWIYTNCTTTEHNILKLDVEGAEFEILPILLDADLHKNGLIAEWFVEFHSIKSPNANQLVVERFLRDVTNYTDWSKMLEEVNHEKN